MGNNRRKNEKRKGEWAETELVWKDKQTEVERTVLPFQTVETVNKPRIDREEVPLLSALKKEEASWKNRLIWGDNKYIMASLLPEFAGKINLIYIDPPFATGADFSINIKLGDLEWTKEASVIEEKAYRDTWGKGLNSYLQMMYERLVLMRELLADNGSIYVHLDWHVGHYVKIMLDEIFGEENFRNQVLWCYKRWTAVSKNFQNLHDILLFYSKTSNYSFNQLLEKYADDEAHFTEKDEKGWYRWQYLGGKKYKLYKKEGVRMGDWWEVSYINSMAKERTGFPTQKPEKLLDRIIKASSNEGDLVADFFCGSGTTGAVAEKLGRRWIMSDLSKFAVHTTRKRLLDIPDCKPFEIQNLGNYQRHKFKENEHPPVEKYIRFILNLYRAEPISGYNYLHGQKSGRMVHIGEVDSIITEREIKEVVKECNATGGKAVDILGWDFEMGLHDVVKSIGDEHSVAIKLVQIPKETTEVKDPAKEEIKFFDLNYLDLDYQVKNRELTVTLKEFIIANPEYIPDDIRTKIKRFTDYIDYWAVDFDYKNDTFHNMWQSFRTKKHPNLEIDCHHTYEKPGKYQVLVKVVDIFGNDTNKLLEIKIV